MLEPLENKMKIVQHLLTGAVNAGSNFLPEQSRDAVKDLVEAYNNIMALKGTPANLIKDVSTEIGLNMDWLARFSQTLVNEVGERKYDQQIASQRSKLLQSAHSQSQSLKDNRILGKGGNSVLIVLHELSQANGDWIIALTWQVRLNNVEEVRKYLQEKFSNMVVSAYKSQQQTSSGSNTRIDFNSSLLTNQKVVIDEIIQDLSRLGMYFTKDLLKSVKSNPIVPPLFANPNTLRQWQETKKIAQKVSIESSQPTINFDLLNLEGIDLLYEEDYLVTSVPIHQEDQPKSGRLQKDKCYGVIGIRPVKEAILALLALLVKRKELDVAQVKEQFVKCKEFIHQNNLFQPMLVKGMRCIIGKIDDDLLQRDMLDGELIRIPFDVDDIYRTRVMHSPCLEALENDDCFQNYGQNQEELFKYFLYAAIVLDSCLDQEMVIISQKNLFAFESKCIDFYSQLCQAQTTGKRTNLNVSQIIAHFICAYESSRRVAPHVAIGSTEIVGLQGTFGSAFILPRGNGMRMKFSWHFSNHSIPREYSGAIFIPSIPATCKTVAIGDPSDISSIEQERINSQTERIGYIVLKDESSGALMFTVFDKEAVSMRQVNYGWCLQRLSYSQVRKARNVKEKGVSANNKLAILLSSQTAFQMAQGNQFIANEDHPIFPKDANDFNLHIFLCGIIHRSVPLIFQDAETTQMIATTVSPGTFVIPFT